MAWLLVLPGFGQVLPLAVPSHEVTAGVAADSELLRQHLRTLAVEMLSSNRYTIAGGPLIGKTAYDPGGGDYRGAGEYVRDWIWTAQAFPEFYSADDLLVHIQLHGSHTNADHSIQDGLPSPTFFGGFDTQFHFVDLLHQHFRKSGNLSAFTTWQSVASNAVAYVPISNHLVYIDGTNINKGWCDSLAQRGHDLVTSLFRLRACRQLAELYRAQGAEAIAVNFEMEVPLIASALTNHLWDPAYGLFRNASVAVTNHNITGSALAVMLNCVDSNKQWIISTKLVSGAPGGESFTNGSKMFVRGIAFNFPLDEMVPIERYNGYQAGGAWPGMTGWAWTAVAKTSPSTATALIAEALSTSFNGEPALTYEWLNFDDSLQGAPEYLWSPAGAAFYTQGAVEFANDPTTVGLPVTNRQVVFASTALGFDSRLVPGASVSSNFAGVNLAGLRAQLYFGVGTDLTAFTPVDPWDGGIATFKNSTSATAGSWYSRSATLQGVNAGTTRNYVVVVWDSTLSTNALSPEARMGLWGASAPFSYTVPAGPAPPPSDYLMANLRSFSIGLSYGPPTIIAQPQSTSVSLGQAWSLGAVVGGSPPLVYQWRAHGTNLPGATGTNLFSGSAQSADAGYYDVVITNDFGSVTSAIVVLQVLPTNAPSIRVNGQLVLASFATPSPATVSITGGFLGGLTFYTLDGTPPTTNVTAYSAPFVVTNSAIITSVSFSSDFSTSAQSPPLNLQILPRYDLLTSASGDGLVNLEPPGGAYLSNTLVTLTAVPATNWTFSHWTGDLTGTGNPAVLTMDRAQNVQAVFYQSAFPLSLSTPGGGNVTADVQSIVAATYYPTGSVILLTAVPEPGWSFQRWQGTTNSTLNPLALVMNQAGAIAGIFATSFVTNIAGAGIIEILPQAPVDFGALVTLTANPAPGHHFVNWSGAVTGTDNPVQLVVTSAVPIVNATFAPTLPVFVTQPTNLSLALDATAVFAVQVTGSPPFSYRWRKDEADLDTVDAPSCTITNIQVGDAGNYDVVVSDVYGHSATSAVAILVVQSPPLIEQQPQSQAGIAESNASFSVTASGPAPLTYQWRQGGVAIGGAVATNYTISGVTSNDAGGYDVVVTNPYGSATSSVAMLTVVYPPAIVTPPVGQILAVSNALNLSVTATGNEPLAYQWTRNGALIAEASNAVYSVASVTTNEAGNYAVIVTNAYGAVTSAVVEVVVYIPVSFTSQPVSQIAPLNGTALFSATAAGHPAPNYQWTFNGAYVADGTGSSLLLTNIVTSMLGGYAVIAWNDYSVATSAVASLLMSPSLAVPFAGITATWGGGATLSVSATGSGSLFYQWFKNGSLVAGGTNSTLHFPVVQISDGGLYSVVVSSAYGSVTNVPALLVVNPANVTLGLYAGLTIQGVTGYTYGIQYSTDLTDTNSWVTLTNLTLAQPSEIWVDTSVDVHAPGNPKRYYRVVVP